MPMNLNEHEHILYDAQTNNHSNTSQYFQKFSISTLNIQGLSKHEDVAHLKEFVSQFDTVGLCETWGGSNDFERFVEGYITFNDMT